jgi:hypothetical protein
MHALRPVVCLVLIGCGSDTVGGSDATADVGASDVVNEAAVDAADAGAAADVIADATDECVVAPQTQCPSCGNIDAGSVCCTQTGTCIANGSSSCLGKRWNCQTRNDCAPNQDCCVSPDQLSFTTCPPSATITLAPLCGLAGSCTGAALCANDNDCDSPKKCVGVVVSDGAVPLGVCH